MIFKTWNSVCDTSIIYMTVRYISSFHYELIEYIGNFIV